MPEPIDPKLLAEIRKRLPHWEEMGKSGLTDSIRSLLDEVDRHGSLVPEHGSSQAVDCATDAAAGLRGAEERLDAIKRLNVTTNGDDQIHVDITPLDPDSNAVNYVLLQWSLDGGWEHPPSGTSGTLGVMLHAIAVSALADSEQEETPDA